MRRDLPPDFEARGSWRLLVPCLVTVVLMAIVGFGFRRTLRGDPISTTEAVIVTGLSALIVAIVVPVVVLRSRVRVYGDLLEYRSAFRSRVVRLGGVTGIDWVKGRNAYEKTALVVSHPDGRIRLSSYTFGLDPLRSLADGLLARCPGARPVGNWSPAGGSTH